MDNLANLPPSTQTLLAAAVVIQVGVAVVSLVVLARWPRSRVLSIGKPVWALVIVLGQMVGPIAFLVAAAMDRRRDGDEETAASPSDRRPDAPTVVADLYGTGHD